jgi:energy-coupling factor transporter ATP-binding protein EcfA2
MSAFANIEYALMLRNVPKAERRPRVQALVDHLGVKIDLKRYPYEMSGGQQQLVSILRALVVEPEVLFLDEPFSALDYEMTLFMREQLQRIFEETKTTMVLVSHDLEEAVYLADYVLLLSRGPARIADYSLVPHARRAMDRPLHRSGLRAGNQEPLSRCVPAGGAPVTRARATDAALPLLGVLGLILLWYLGYWPASSTRCSCRPRTPPPARSGRAWRTGPRLRFLAHGGAHAHRHRGGGGDRHPGRDRARLERTDLPLGRVRHRLLPLDPGLRHVPPVPRDLRVGDKTKIYVASFGAALVIVFNVAYGVMNARKTRILAAKVMGASRWRIMRDVILMESLPQTFIGLRNGVSLALVIVVVAEMFIGSVDGLGHRVFEAQQLLEMPDMYAAIFAAGALGYGLNVLFMVAEKSFVHWSGK